MDKKQIALMAVDALKAEYPDAICSLVDVYKRQAVC